VVLAPVAGVKPAEVLRNPTGFAKAFNPPVTEAKGIRLRGELGISRKPIAQGMPGCSGCTCMLVCVFLAHIAHETAGASRHPAFPAPSCSGGTRFMKRLGRNAPREGETVSTSLRAQRSNPSIPALNHGLLRFARNDVDRARSRRMGRAQRNPSPK